MKTAAILVARLIFGFVFAMGAAFKFVFIGMDATAAEIAAAGFPVPPLLAWVAAIFETALAICYVLFLAFSFHGPERFAKNPMEFGFFVNHFTFVAGLLFAAVHGPGDKLVVRWRRI